MRWKILAKGGHGVKTQRNGPAILVSRSAQTGRESFLTMEALFETLPRLWSSDRHEIVTEAPTSPHAA
jgi:hypothetical protein